MAFYVTQRKAEVRPSWMLERVHKQLMERQEEEDFKKRSAQAKENKRGGSENGVIQPGHCQGSISTTEVAKKMAAEKNGVLPLAKDLYLRTYCKEDPTQGKVLCGDKAKKIMDDYEKRMEEYSEPGITKDPNEVYLEVAGGWKKGKVLGVGSGAELFTRSLLVVLLNLLLSCLHFLLNFLLKSNKLNNKCVRKWLNLKAKELSLRGKGLS